MLSLRTKKSEEFYQKDVQQAGCFICGFDLLVKEYKKWVILENKYPYDAISNKHHLLCPKRHIATREEMTVDELDELKVIRKETGDLYDFEQWNYPRRQTHPIHFHYHLIKFKNEKRTIPLS
jgi:diadenosine tetraphosphate (Ap4A) HIT family hydrolase